MATKEKNWKWIAGGCELKSKKKFPCDDQYINLKTKKTFLVYSTYEAHLDRKNFPVYVSSISDVLKRGLVVKKR